MCFQGVHVIVLYKLTSAYLLTYLHVTDSLVLSTALLIFINYTFFFCLLLMSYNGYYDTTVIIEPVKLVCHSKKKKKKSVVLILDPRPVRNFHNFRKQN